MKSFLVRPALCLKGEITLAGDKSIAHRCVIISAISEGQTVIENFPANKDCLYTVEAFKKLGLKIRQAPLKTDKSCVIRVYGKGLYGLSKPRVPIFVGESGTTLRLLLGVLTGQNFKAKLIAGKSLNRRPMLRVAQPLRMMGADIKSQSSAEGGPAYGGHNGAKSQVEEYPPITIKGGNPKPITYKMPVASAQVKSAILLAGLYPLGISRIIEPISTRDHTERILKLFKAKIKVQQNHKVSETRQNAISIRGGKELVSPKKIYIPGDISSASFFLVAAGILPNSSIFIKDVSLNPSRTGIIRVLKRMGARIQVSSFKSQASGFEPMGNIMVKSSKLKGTIIKKEEIPSLIDELPILMVAGCFAKGRTIFEGVGELRLKETDRISSMCDNLRKMGAHIQVLKDGKLEKILIKGAKDLFGNKVRSFGDHRTAMSMVIAGLRAKGKTLIDDISCIEKSFPNFLSLLKNLTK